MTHATVDIICIHYSTCCCVNSKINGSAWEVIKILFAFSWSQLYHVIEIQCTVPVNVTHASEHTRHCLCGCVSSQCVYTTIPKEGDIKNTGHVWIRVLIHPCNILSCHCFSITWIFAFLPTLLSHTPCNSYIAATPCRCETAAWVEEYVYYASCKSVITLINGVGR